MTDKPPKPMLACKDWDIGDLEFPVMVQPKLDGVRALVKDGVVYGRSGEPIINKMVQEMFGRFHGYDGELVLKDHATRSDCCRLTTGLINSPERRDECEFRVYDFWSWPGVPFRDRLKLIQREYADALITFTVCNSEELMHQHRLFLNAGYEGTIVRSPEGVYKHGRSTKNDGRLLAFKDTEATVIGSEELMRNMNVAEKDAFGHTKRSTKKAGKVPSGQLGVLKCKSPLWEKTFDIGTGFTTQERITLWADRESLIGRTVRFRYFDHGGKERPRHPSFITFRDSTDMDKQES